MTLTQGATGNKGAVGNKGAAGNKGATGNKGAVGSRGQAGDQGFRGQVGERGDSGDRGVTGERGPQGDHGQRGEQGQEGPAGADAHILGRRQTLALFLFTVIGFVTIAYRTEVADDRITQYGRETCQSTRTATLKFNAQQAALGNIERTNRNIDAKTRTAQIKVYQDATLTPPVCKATK